MRRCLAGCRGHDWFGGCELGTITAEARVARMQVRQAEESERRGILWRVLFRPARAFALAWEAWRQDYRTEMACTRKPSGDPIQRAVDEVFA